MAEALRFNSDKPMMAYFMRSFPRMAEAVARVKEMGAIKYNDGNWRLGNKPDDEYWNSMFRHLDYIFVGETYDKDTGCLHIAHAVWNLCALLELNHPDLPARDDEIWAERAVHWAAEKVKREAEEERQRLINDPKWDEVPEFVAPRGDGEVYVRPPKAVFGSARPLDLRDLVARQMEEIMALRAELEERKANAITQSDVDAAVRAAVKKPCGHVICDCDSPSELDIDPATEPSYIEAGCIEVFDTKLWSAELRRVMREEALLAGLLGSRDDKVKVNRPPALDPAVREYEFIHDHNGLLDEVREVPPGTLKCSAIDMTILDPTPEERANSPQGLQARTGFDDGGFYIGGEKVAEIDPESVKIGHQSPFNQDYLDGPDNVMPPEEWTPPGCENGACSHCADQFCGGRDENQLYRETADSKEGARVWERITHDSNGMLRCQQCCSDVVWHSTDDKGIGYWECECGYDWEGEISERYDPHFDERDIDKVGPGADEIRFTIKDAEASTPFKDLIAKYLPPYLLEMAQAQDRKMFMAVDEVMSEMDQGVRTVGDVMREMDARAGEGPRMEHYDLCDMEDEG